MNLSSYPSIASELAAERRSRFMAEADHVRQLAQLHRGRGLETAAARFMKAVRVKAMTGAARVESWGARRGHQWLLAGES